MEYFAISCGLLAANLLYLVVTAIHNTLLSPLSKIPDSHLSAPFSSLWIKWLRHQNQLNRFLEAAHDAYGPVVRLGPNELSVNCVQDGFKTIYTTKAFEKHHFYLKFKNYM